MEHEWILWHNGFLFYFFPSPVSIYNGCRITKQHDESRMQVTWSLELRNCYFLLNTIVDTFCYQRISFPEHTKTLSQNTFPTHSTALICGSFRHWHLSTSNINAHMLRLHESKYYRETTTSIRHMSFPFPNFC